MLNKLVLFKFIFLRPLVSREKMVHLAASNNNEHVPPYLPTVTPLLSEAAANEHVENEVKYLRREINGWRQNVQSILFDEAELEEVQKIIAEDLEPCVIETIFVMPQPIRIKDECDAVQVPVRTNLPQNAQAQQPQPLHSPSDVFIREQRNVSRGTSPENVDPELCGEQLQRPHEEDVVSGDIPFTQNVRKRI